MTKGKKFLLKLSEQQYDQLNEIRKLMTISLFRGNPEITIVSTSHAINSLIEVYYHHFKDKIEIITNHERLTHKITWYIYDYNALRLKELAKMYGVPETVLLRSLIFTEYKNKYLYNRFKTV